MLAGTQQLASRLQLKPKCLAEKMMKASICHKSKLPEEHQNPQQKFNVEKYSWNHFTMWMDPFTKCKMNENSKIIQVDGNVKCGKQDFAKRLADELGMKYMPPIDITQYYINDHGYDYRALNPLLPERLRICDLEMFHEYPSRHSVIHMQTFMFKMRLLQYIKACQHLLNTGQGVIMGRSVFTERAIVEAMHEIGWLPLGHQRGDGVRFYDWKYRYNYIRGLCLSHVLRPHLTIYLETPVDVCMENIKNCSDPMIRESKALVPEFLESIERAFKETVLPKQNQHGHILSYDYSKRATDDEIMDVVDDLEAMDFEYDIHDTHFEDWNASDMLWYYRKRREYTTKYLINHFRFMTQAWYDIAGLGDSITEADLKLRTSLFEANVGPFGQLKDYGTDLNHQTFLKAFFDIKPFNEFIKGHIHSDFE